MSGNFFNDEFDPEQTKEEVASRLEQSFPDRDSSELRELADETVEQYVDAPVTGFIANVAEHEVRNRLREDDATGGDND